MTLNLIARNLQILKNIEASFNENRTVWLAQDTKHNRIVVLREYRFVGCEQAEEVEKTVKTCYNQRLRLQHPGIPRCYGYFLHLEPGREDIGSYLIMEEYKPGQSFEKGFHLTLPQLHSIIVQVLEILVYGQSLNPPCFHNSLNAGDIVIHHLSDQTIKVSMLNIGLPDREMGEEVDNAEVWGYDLARLGSIVLKVLSGNVTSQILSIENHFGETIKHFNPQFLQRIYQLSGQGSLPRFYNAAEAHSSFVNILPITPLKPIKFIPIPSLIMLAVVSVLFFGMFFANTDLMLIDNYLSKQIPGMQSLLHILHRFQWYTEHLKNVSCVPLSFAFACETSTVLPAVERMAFNAVLCLEMILVWCGIAAMIFGCFTGAILAGITGGILLIALGTLWFTHYILFFTLKAILAIALASSLIFLLIDCWSEMRQSSQVSHSHQSLSPCPRWFALSMLLSTYQAGAAFFELMVWFLIGQHVSTFLIILYLVTLTSWLVWLLEPEMTYQKDRGQFDKAAALVLKG
ncbi:hypothetical protein [Tolypothrix sp. VBCCA 56010]|uniref:hypothetical protein n=1 Tax=Tolypothrix sp. VBCCA 56010 TaxID=3137731 RepID=UPI003D7CF311